MENVKSTETTPAQAIRWAIISIIGFLMFFVALALKNKWPEGANYIIAYSGVISHLSLLPIVAFMSVPQWAKVSGYSWAMLDSLLSVAALHGMAEDTTVFQLRMGLHVIACIWPFTVGWYNTGVLRWFGFALGLAMGILPLLGTLNPKEIAFMPLPFLFLLFMGSIIFKLRKEHTQNVLK